MRAILIVLIAIITLSSNALATSKSMCPDKVLGAEAVEGVYLGTVCEDFCYSDLPPEKYAIEKLVFLT